jgi:ABC-type branched-subunit amino acid transport system permease subunit
MRTQPKRIGVDALRIKRHTYLISAFLTALAGTFYVQYIYFIDPNTAFSFNISVEAALVSIVGGIGTLWGPVVGTVLLEAMAPRFLQVMPCRFSPQQKTRLKRGGRGR